MYNSFRKLLRKSEKIARVEPDEDKPPPARRTPAPTMREGGASNGGARDLRPPFFSYESGSYQPMTQYGAERYGGQR